MTNVIRVALTDDADTYVVKNLSPAQSDVWVGFDVHFPTELPPSNDDSGLVVGVGDGIAISNCDSVWVTDVSGTAKWETDNNSDGPFSTVVADTWYHVDFRAKQGTRASELWIDGVDQAITPTGTQANNATRIALGAISTVGWETTYEVLIANITIGTSKGGFEIFSTDLSGGLGEFDDTETGAGATLEIIEDPTGSAPEGGGPDGGGGTDVGDPSGGVLVAVAFDADAFAAAPTWTALDGVQSVRIDRGRQYELDRTSTGTATITLVDTTGQYDPTGGGGADPLRQIKVELVNPVDETQWMLYRGFVSSWGCSPHPTEDFLFITIECVDALDLFAATELMPGGDFGAAVSTGNEGDVVYEEVNELDAVQERIRQVLDEIGWPSGLTSIFTGNVALQEVVYAARTPALTVMQDAADAEFPTVANLYVSKTGKVTFHGRFARFHFDDPQYHINTWDVGDLPAALGSPSTVVPVSPPIDFYRDKENLFTAAQAIPKGLVDEDAAANYLVAAAATDIGLRTWSAENLLTLRGDESRTALEETALMADYVRDNYATSPIRVGALTIKPQDPTGPHGAATWALMSQIDISDVVTINTSHVGGGGFADPFFTEGIHYVILPGGDRCPDVTLTLDVSPSSLYDSNPFE